MARAWFLLIASASLFLAGCAGSPTSGVQGSGGPTGDATQPAVSHDTGSIAGFVVNDEAKPIAGARVAIRELGAQPQVADAAGAFTFNGLPPGIYTLFAEQLGFESKAQSATVVAGEITTVRFVLASLVASGQARQLSYEADGFIELAVALPEYGVQYFNETGETLNVIKYKVAPDVAGSVVGLTWQSGAPFTGRFIRANAWLCKPANDCDEVNFTRSFSPLVLRSDGLQETVEGKSGYFVGTQWYPTICSSVSNDFCVANPDTVASVTAQQRYKAYTAVFFVDPAPLGYSPVP